MNSVTKYFGELSSNFGAAWNRFWFSPADTYSVSALRLLTCIMSLWYLLSFSTGLGEWFGVNGIIPLSAIRQLTLEPGEGWNGRVSYFYFLEDPTELWIVHGLGMLVLAAFTVGLA